MTAPKLARRAARLLAAEELEARTSSTSERDQTMEAIRDALSRRAQRGRRRRWALPIGGVAAAAALVLIASTWSRRAAGPVVAAPAAPAAPASPAVPAGSVVAATVRGTVFIEQGLERLALRSGTPVVRGSTIVALDGEARVVLRSGSTVNVEHATRASVIEDGETERLDLERGAVTSTVTKRGPTQRFLIRTPDAEVEVRGTIFRVSRLEDASCGFQTRVHVDEGRVVVRAAHEDTALERGGEWVSRCLAPAAAVASVAASGAVEAQTAPSSASRGATSPSSSRQGPVAAKLAPAPPSVEPGPSASSDLAAQNALFADAMSSKARGDTRSALTSLEFLLDKYPRTPLREAAEAQRMMLVSGSDKARAATLARGYLNRYPHGFARADAERILHDGP